MSHAGEGDCRVEPSGTVVYLSNSQDNQKLSTRVLEALGSVPGYDVESSDTIVFDHVDLDALDELFTATDGRSRQRKVTFPVGEYHVTATANDEVIVCTS